MLYCIVLPNFHNTHSSNIWPGFNQTKLFILDYNAIEPQTKLTMIRFLVCFYTYISASQQRSRLDLFGSRNVSKWSCNSIHCTKFIHQCLSSATELLKNFRWNCLYIPNTTIIKLLWMRCSNTLNITIIKSSYFWASIAEASTISFTDGGKMCLNLIPCGKK